MVVLVTGANGQLGQALQKIAKTHSDIRFVLTDSKTLDITDKENCERIFKELKPDFCINTAAYTAVDKAESEADSAHKINVSGVENLAESCKKYHTTLIHISTDFVFDGEKNIPYTENDKPNPKSIYGKTKFEGEQVIQSLLENYYIIRTSWLYSEFGNNFYKTMLRLGSEKEFLNVVNDQIGTPTNANCLAKVIIEVVRCQMSDVGSLKAEEKIPTPNTQHLTPDTRHPYGIYNFSNEGNCSWYDFAKKIFELHNIQITLNPIPTSSYPTAAIRPKYSVLDKTKIKTVFGIKIKPWEEGLGDLRFEI
ncbi:MAG: dTDP-4-dehydrorhamnose reductase [Flavobacteriaceae bacterium]